MREGERDGPLWNALGGGGGVSSPFLLNISHRKRTALRFSLKNCEIGFRECKDGEKKKVYPSLRGFFFQ